jgi:hypothetical protein
MPELLTQEPCERGQLAAFKSERWPASARNDGRLEVGKPGRIESESTRPTAIPRSARSAALLLMQMRPSSRNRVNAVQRLRM